ncbi:MAG TPA: M1 family aminopeptidase [Ignavibacteriaceae bacterium]|nr:M1 family aminopeptidase [Ignavibacteriaceae bacterium]
MKRILPVILLTTCFYIPELFCQIQSDNVLFCSQKKINSENLINPAEINANIPHSFDAINYELDLNVYNCFLSPYPKTFTGYEILTFQADSTINSISLNAVNASLIIQSVGLAGSSFTHSNDILTITLDRTYNPGETAEVKINYSHKNVSDNAFYVSNGFVFTDCEPQGARKWFPCWDRPSDKATFNLKAKTPANVKLGSNGILQDSTVSGDTILYNWVSNFQVATYLMVMTAKVNYNLDIVYWHKISNPNDSIPIRFYWNSGENTDNLHNIESVLPDMMTYYSTLFGEHPFDKNGFATLNSQFPWGGMENQTLTSLCPDCWSQGLISHEFTHQWFGDMITCATWADVWLNEGFAQYGQALWREHLYGHNDYKNAIESYADYYMSNNPGWPIYNPDWINNIPPTSVLFNQAITYDKGACVHHMLRYVMGDTLYFRGLRHYAADPELRFKSAVTTDFRDDMSETYGQDLTWFFDEWINQPDHPAYENGYWILDQGSGNWQVGFLAKQTQTSTPFHKMPVQIEISFTSGNDTTVRVMNDVNSQVFTFNFNREPSNVTFDPDNNIVLKTATLTEITPVSVEQNDLKPDHYHLAQNYPNPFNPSTTIEYSIPNGGIVKIMIFNILGEEIRTLENGYKEAGVYKINFNASDLPSGIYYYRIESGNFISVRKMILLK